MSRRSKSLLSIRCLWIAIVSLAVMSGPARSQDSNLTSASHQKETGLTLDSLGVAPQTSVIPGGMLVVSAVVRNSGTETAVGYVVARIVGNNGEESRRRVVLKGGEQKHFDVQIRVPGTLPDGNIEILGTLNVLDGEREVLVLNGDQPVSRTLTLPQQRDSLITAMAISREPAEGIPWRWTRKNLFATYEMAVATRIDAGMSRQCLVFDSVPFPLNSSDWKSVDTLVIADPEVFYDVATQSVLKKFLQNGGRIWVMLDWIETDAVANLLAEDQQCQTVSTVELNRFVVDAVGQSISEKERTIDLEVPVSFKQVIQQGGTASHSVNGWPAAIWMPIGRGELLLTTLGCAAWIEPRVTQSSNDPLFQSQYELRSWARTFVNQVQVNRVKPPLNMVDAKYPVERIGNPVVSRALVAFVLMSFCGCLVAFGIWKYLAGELQWVGFAAPCLALVASLPLIVAAVLQRKGIPAMISVLQLVQCESPTGGSLRESGAVYSGQSESMQLVGKGDGGAIPSEAVESGVKTLSIDDFQEWRMSNTAWPTGTWRYSAENSLSNSRMVARADLNKEGLHIELPTGLPSALSDAVLIFSAGSPTLAANLSKSELLVNGEFPAEGERWTMDSMVSDEQHRRATIYKKLLEDEARTNLPTRSLCGWTDLWADGPQWDRRLEQRGTALTTLPVHLATPEIGSQVFIPHSLIDIRHASPQKASSIFMEATGRWITQSSLTADAEIAFILPTEVVPLQVSAIDIDWDLQAPGRRVGLSCVSESGEPHVEIVSLNAPSIPWKHRIEDPRVLKEMQDGRLVLRVEVSEVRDAESFLIWHIKHLRLAVSGTTLPRNSLVTKR